MNPPNRSLDEVLADHEGVLSTSMALQFMTANQLRWQVVSGRWQKPQGFEDKRPFAETAIHLLVPAGHRRRTPPPGLTVITHYARALTDQDVHPTRQPRRTRIARSLIDAATWRPAERGSMAVLAAGVQQRLVRKNPEYVARRILEALRTAGHRG